MARWGATCSGRPGTTTDRGPCQGTENVTIREAEAPTTADRILDAAAAAHQPPAGSGTLPLAQHPGIVEEPTRMLKQRPWTSLGVGFVGLIAFGVVVFLVIVVAVLLGIGMALVGLSDLVGAIVFAALAAIVLLAFVFFLIGCVRRSRLGRNGVRECRGFSLDSAARRWAALIIGLIIVVALTSIPVVGGWLGLIVICFGLGAGILAFRPRRTTTTTVEPTPISPSSV